MIIYMDDKDSLFNERLKVLDSLSEAVCEFDRSCELYPLQEGKIIDIIYTFLRYLKRFIDFLGNITNQFRSKFSSIIRNDRFILESKDEVNKYNPGTNQVIEERFIYQFLEDPDIPNANPNITKLDLFMTNIKFFKDNLSFDFMKKTKVKEIEQENIAMEDSYKTEEYLSIFRAALFKQNELVPANVYPEYCKRIFRGDSKTPQLTGVVPYDEMQDIFARFSRYRKIVESIDKTYRNIKKEYDEILIGFQKKASEVKYFDNVGPYQDEFENQIRRFYQNKANLIQKMTQIHLYAFQEKLQAIKECYLTDRKILLRCIDNVINNKKD